MILVEKVVIFWSKTSGFTGKWRKWLISWPTRTHTTGTHHGTHHPADPPPRVPPRPRPPRHTTPVYTTTPPCHTGVHGVLQWVYSGIYCCFQWETRVWHARVVSDMPAWCLTCPRGDISVKLFYHGRVKNGDFQWFLVKKWSENVMGFETNSGFWQTVVFWQSGVLVLLVFWHFSTLFDT